MPYFHETTPEKEFEIARAAMAKSDLAAAAYHVGTALGFDPLRTEWLALLDEIVRTSGDPLTLLRLDAARSDVITAATRAWALARMGRFRDAYDLLIDVAESRPDLGFLIWGAQWLQMPGAAEALDLEYLESTLVPRLLGVITACPSPLPESDRRRATVQAAGHVATILRERYPERPLVLMAGSLILRRLGHFDHAIHWAYQAFEKEATWRNAAAVASAYRDAGRVDEAVQWYRHAAGLDPADLTALLDAGDTYLEAERWEDAIGAHQSVLARQADHPWSAASIAYARFRLTGDRIHQNTLFRLSALTGRAWELFCRIEPPQPYVHFLPPPADATANALRGILRDIAKDPGRAHGGRVSLHVTHPESPSVLTAFRLWTQSRGIDVGIDIAVDRVQNPDPRLLKAQVEFSLWAYDGLQARPNVPLPDPRVLAEVEALAREPYNLDLWDPLAREAASRLGTPAWSHLAFCMIHSPPLPTPETDPFDWLGRVQMAAALILAYLDSGWEQSYRKHALWTLLLGPVDWITDAALVAVGWLGRGDPAVRAEAAAFFAWMEQQLPNEGYTCFEYPLVCAWSMLGGHDEATRQRLDEWRQRVEERKRAAPTEAGPERHAGLTLEQYAELSFRRDQIVSANGGRGALAALIGGGSLPELAQLCREFGLDPNLAVGGPSAAAGRIPEWDARINADPRVQEMFLAMVNDARLRSQGIGFNEHEGRVAEMIRVGAYDVEAARVDAEAAARKLAAEESGDPDPLVFPGQPLAKLSDYVGLMKRMQTGDMMGALAHYRLDMGQYGAVAQAWGVKLASDPLLNAKFAKMMQG